MEPEPIEQSTPSDQPQKYKWHPATRNENRPNLKPLELMKRYNPETKHYDKKPLDPEYFKKYWLQVSAKKEGVTCEHCGTLITQQCHLSRHQRTKLCMKRRQLKEAHNNTIKNGIRKLTSDVSSQTLISEF